MARVHGIAQVVHLAVGDELIAEDDEALGEVPQRLVVAGGGAIRGGLVGIADVDDRVADGAGAAVERGAVREEEAEAVAARPGADVPRQVGSLMSTAVSTEAPVPSWAMPVT